MPTNIYKSLSDDVLNLFLTTKNRKIEDLYLKCAAAEQNSFREFLDLYLAKPENAKPISKETIDALRSLYSVHDNIGSSPELFALSQFFLKNTSQLGCLPTIKLLREIASEGAFSEVLSQFSALFSSSQNITPKDEGGNEMPPTISKDKLRSDLSILTTQYNRFLTTGTVEKTPPKAPVSGVGIPGEDVDEMFEDKPIPVRKKKETKQEKLQSLVRYCLSGFSEELENALAASGRNDLKGKFSMHNLADPWTVTKGMAAVRNPTTMGSDITATVKYIMTKIANTPTHDLYDYIRTRALYMSFQISRDQMVQYFRGKTSDLSGLLGEKTEQKPISIDARKLLTSEFVTYVSLVTYHLLEKSK